MNAKIESLKGEFDVDRAQALALEIAQLVAEGAYFVQAQAYATKSLEVRWPVVQNVGVNKVLTGINRQHAETTPHWWIDPSKPPLGNS